MAEALVLDDDEFTRQILRILLERLGWTVREAEDVRSGLARMRETPPVDVALVDWMLGTESGIDFVRAVRGDPNLRSAKLLMVTMNNEPDQVGEALEAGADEYLMKPVGREELCSKLALLGLLDSDGS